MESTLELRHLNPNVFYSEKELTELVGVEELDVMREDPLVQRLFSHEEGFHGATVLNLYLREDLRRRPGEDSRYVSARWLAQDAGLKLKELLSRQHDGEPVCESDVEFIGEDDKTYYDFGVPVENLHLLFPGLFDENPTTLDEPKKDRFGEEERRVLSVSLTNQNPGEFLDEREKFIRATIGSYDLTPERRGFLIDYFNKKVERGRFGSFEAIYRHITTNMDRWSIWPISARSMLSLDNLLVAHDHDSSSFVDFLEVEDNPLDKLIEEEERLETVDALGIILDRLRGPEHDVLRRLVEVASSGLNLDEQSVGESAEQIIERVRQVANLLYVNNRLVIPRKNIFVIENNGQLDIRVGNLDGEVVRRVYEAHGLDMSYWDAGIYAGVGHMTVRDLWKKAGLESVHRRDDGKRGRRPVEPEKLAKIYEAHENGLGCNRAARFAGVSKPTVLKYWHLAGLEVGPSYGGIFGRQTGLKDEQIAEIVDAHESCGGIVAEANRRLPYSHLSIKKYWDEHGLVQPRAHKNKEK